LRRGLWSDLPRTHRRAQEGARDLVPLPAVHRPGRSGDGARERGGAARAARGGDGCLVPGDARQQSPRAALPQVRVQRGHRRPSGHPGARRQRDASLLYVRGGAGGTKRVPREAEARLLALRAAAVTRSEAWLAAFRVRTWPAAVVPVVVGTALAAHAGRAQASVAAIALMAALL